MEERPSIDFVQWFVGFSEGDGSFVVATTRKSLSFVITQSTEDIQILYLIQKTLNIGKVIQQGPTTSRFVVQDRRGLELIISLLNGRIVFPSRQQQFERFVSAYNQKYKTNIQYIQNQPIPSSTNAWLSGLIDAEGCFTCTFLNNSKAYRFRFFVTQKYQINRPILESFIQLFPKGKIYNHSVPDVYDFILNGIKPCSQIFFYIEKYPLKTKKSRSYFKWKELFGLICTKQHLSPETREFLKKKAAEINKQS